MSVKRIFHNFLIGFILVLGIGAVSTSGFMAAEAKTANADLSPQLGIMAVIAVPDTGLTTTEAGDPATFDVSLDTPPPGLVTDMLSSSNTPEGKDFPATIDFDTGDYDVPQTATVTWVDDAIDDGDQPYTINLTSSEENISIGVTNLDDDPIPTVSFTTDTQSGVEDVGTMTITAELSAESGLEVTVPYTLSGTATDVDDYTISPSPLVISAGNLLADITIAVIEDALDEDDEDVIVTMGTPINADPGATIVHTATITDNDPLPSVTFNVDGQVVPENFGTTTLTAELSEVSGRDVTIPYILSGTATEVEDYSIDPNPLVISAGNPSADLTITVVDDALDEDEEESIIVTMDTPVNADPGATTEHTATITDDDPLPTVTFTTDAQAGAENVGNLTVTAELSEVSGRDVTLPYVLSGSATDVDDYSITPASPLVISAGSLSADLTINVVVDADDEGSEDIVITMDPPVNADPGATTIHTATIVDIPTVAFTTDSQQEAESIGSMTITAELSAVSGLEVTVPYTLSGDADNTSDFTIAPAPPLYIPAGELSTDITITVIDDLIDEDNETVIVEIDSPVNADPGTITEHTATIADDDTAGITVLDPGTLSPPVELLTSEDGLSDTFTVQLDTQPEYDVTIALSSNNESEGTIDKSSLTFTEATWNVPQTVTITGVDDDIADDDIVFNIEFEKATSTDDNYDGLKPDEDVIVRNSDDETPGYTVAPIDGLWTTEGMLSTIINVKLKSKPKDAVTLDISSTDTDEGTVSPTQIIVQPDDWKTAIEIQVTGVDDTVVDGDKPYQVVIQTTSADDKYNDETFTRDIINYDAPTIEWDLPVEDGGVYEVDNLVPIQIRVKKIGDEPISKVRFYRWSVSLQDHVTIGEVSKPPYELFLDPTNLEDGFNQIFAFAFGPEPVNPEDKQTFSKHKLIYIFRRADMVFRVYSPLISNQ
jgi:hypothetical protein